MPRAIPAIVGDLALDRRTRSPPDGGRWRRARRSWSIARWSRPASFARGCRPATPCSARWASRAWPKRRGRWARPARPPPSTAGATSSRARWSPSATRRPRCSVCSNCSMPARRRPALILGFPVGFVGAAESKEALIAHPAGVPFVTLRGRRGGSAFAAAAVNALAGRRRREPPGSPSSASARTALAGLCAVRAARWSTPPSCWSAASGTRRWCRQTPAERLTWQGGVHRAAERDRPAGAAGGSSSSPPAIRCGSAAAPTWPATFGPDEMTVLPHPGAFSLAAARDAVAAGRRRVRHRARPAAGDAQPAHPAGRAAAGAQPRRRHAGAGGGAAGRARLRAERASACWSTWAGRRSAGSTASRRNGGIRAPPTSTRSPSNAGRVPRRALLPPVPGLPDELFEHDGQLTKREVRAVTIAALAPLPGQMLWDVGAGSGSIAIEWLRAAPRHARSRVAARRAPSPSSATPTAAPIIARNAAALGVPQLEDRRRRGAGRVRRRSSADPDAIFVGGGVARPGPAGSLLGPTAGRAAAWSRTPSAWKPARGWSSSAAHHGGELSSHRRRAGRARSASSRLAAADGGHAVRRWMKPCEP